MVVCNHLDRGLGSVCHVHTLWYSNVTNAELSETRDHELLLCDNIEVASWVVTNGHVNSNIGLRVAQSQLYGTAADWEVGTLLLDIVEASAREIALLVIVESARWWVVEVEVGEGEGEDREPEESICKHLDGRRMWLQKLWFSGQERSR